MLQSGGTCTLILVSLVRRDPFHSNQPRIFEKALLRTEKLAQSWLTHPIRDASHVELRVEQQPYGPIQLLVGRFIVGCDSASRFVLHDIDANTEPHGFQKQVIWEQEEPVLSWDVSSMTTEDGRSVVYVLLSEKKLDVPRWYVCNCCCRSIPLGRFQVLILCHSSYRKLLGFCFNGESVKLCAIDAFDVPASEFKSNVVKLQGGKSPFLYIPRCKLVFDTQTRIFYEFSNFFSFRRCVAVNYNS